jgi:hypothetical protein
MKWVVALTLLSLFIAGCPSPFTIIAKNRENLMELKPGMNKQEVLSVMGTGSVVDSLGNTITNPYRTDAYMTKDGNFYEIIFYHTEEKNNSLYSTADDELTPLVFENDILIGWGWTFLNQNIDKFEIRAR